MTFDMVIEMKLKLKTIVDILKDLNEHELEYVFNQVKHEDYIQINPIENLKDLILRKKATELQDRPCCPHCNSHHVVKYGHKNGVQRFKCKECNHTFTWSNNTIIYGLKKKYETFLKYCDCLMRKMTIRECAVNCKISIRISFQWRHKILDALQNMHNEVVLDGIVESDETYFALSFKGNRKLESLHRIVHHRGSSSGKRGLSNEQVCTSCSCNLNGLSIGRITNLGKPKTSELSKFLNGRIEEGTFFITDSLNSYDLIAESNNLTHIKIESGKFKNGQFNIQKINSYHNELKRLVNGKFKGVATKYLNNYVVYHNFVNIAKESFQDKLNILKEFVSSTLCISKGYLIKFRDAVPI